MHMKRVSRPVGRSCAEVSSTSTDAPSMPSDLLPRSRQLSAFLGGSRAHVPRMCPGEVAGVQAADLGGDGRDVDRPGRVHGDQRADADRPVGRICPSRTAAASPGGPRASTVRCTGRERPRRGTRSAPRPSGRPGPAACPALHRCPGGSWLRSPCRPRGPRASTAPQTTRRPAAATKFSRARPRPTYRASCCASLTMSLVTSE
jgi:hypothetical protein